jgi:hypothetical protein
MSNQIQFLHICWIVIEYELGNKIKISWHIWFELEANQTESITKY